jgi:hypothetical protein
MIHIVWSGYGFLVAVVVFGFSLAANFITNSATGSGKYWDAHKWPFAVSLLMAGVTCLLVGGIFRNKNARILIDPETGENVVLRVSHTFFFVPMIWWGPILIAIAFVTLAMERAI